MKAGLLHQTAFKHFSCYSVFYMISQLLFFIPLYELSRVFREQIEFFKRIITGFFLKLHHRLCTHAFARLTLFALFQTKRRDGTAPTLLYYKWSGLLVLVTCSLLLIPFTIFNERRESWMRSVQLHLLFLAADKKVHAAEY